MISGIRHGATDAARSGEYPDHPNETGVPDRRATGGNRGVYALRRIENDLAHLLTLERIEGFAGAGPERAGYYPEDERYLPEFEPGIEHYEVVVGP